jgi:hypothetical protein
MNPTRHIHALSIRVAAALAVVAALLAAAVPAAADAKSVAYKGKTTGGHKVTFRYAKGEMNRFTTGVPMTCLSIQGGGAPISGAELWSFDGVGVGLKSFEFSEKSKPSLYWGEVTKNHRITTRRARNGTISGSIRVQYGFLVPKYPPGTFAIYSCLGNTKFSARPVR